MSAAMEAASMDTASMDTARLAGLIAAHPDWQLDHDNKWLYAGYDERRLLVQRCAACGRWQHPPRPICSTCWSPDVVPTPVTGTGTVFLSTVYRAVDPVFGAVDPDGACMVTVELAEQPGLFVTSRFVGAQQPPIGAPVVMRFVDRLGAPFPVFDEGPGGR
jgi:uncharacterized OB-fold protein